MLGPFEAEARQGVRRQGIDRERGHDHQDHEDNGVQEGAAADEQVLEDHAVVAGQVDSARPDLAEVVDVVQNVAAAGGIARRDRKDRALRAIGRKRSVGGAHEHEAGERRAVLGDHDFVVGLVEDRPVEHARPEARLRGGIVCVDDDRPPGLSVLLPLLRTMNWTSQLSEGDTPTMALPFGQRIGSSWLFAVFVKVGGAFRSNNEGARKPVEYEPRTKTCCTGW